jgi:hypothetical protein
LDASAYRDRICDIFTNDQAATLGFTAAPRLGGSAEFIFCGRESKEPPVSLSLVYATPELFSKVNGDSSTPLDYVDLVTISGQPALEQGSPDLSNIVRYCTIVLGLTNDQAMQIDLYDPQGPGGACERATKVAEAIVRNLGG